MIKSQTGPGRFPRRGAWFHVDNVSNTVYVCNMCIIQIRGYEKFYGWGEKRCFVGVANPLYLEAPGHRTSALFTNEES
jgi:hypothetical protein